MPHVVFLMHGMGTHRPTWSDSVRKKLNDVALTYAAFKNGPPLDERVNFVEISYDRPLTRYVNEFADSLKDVTTLASNLGVSLDKVARAFPDPTDTAHGFFWDSVVDVLLYFQFRICRTDIRVQVMKQIATALQTRMTGGRIVEASVIAHSLGTCVMSDSLALLGTQQFEGSDAFLAGKVVKFSRVFTLANVSKEIATDFDPYNTVLHPDSAVVTPASPSYCVRYINFRHQLDPFCLLSPFEPPTWGSDFTNVDKLRHFRDLNVHGLEHYLDHPRVHIPLINGLFGTAIITPQERANAFQSYNDLPGECGDEIRDLEEFLRGVKRPTDLQELVILGAQFLDKAKKLRSACKGAAAGLLNP